MATMKHTTIQKVTLALVILIFLSIVSGCHRESSSASNTTAEGSPIPVRSVAPPGTDFNQDMEYVRKSNFAHVWVVSRKDGKPLDSSDGAYLRTNAPQVVDWVKTDYGKKFIAGTNFDLELGGLNLLKKRFNVEDYTGR
jgi:hypothetical protein